MSIKALEPAGTTSYFINPLALKFFWKLQTATTLREIL